MKTLILGIGNTILGDDGVGVHTVHELEKLIDDASIDIMDTNTDSLNMLDFLPGYDRLIVVDAIITLNGKVGEIYRLKPEDVYKPSAAIISPHHANIITTLEMGRVLFPGEIPEDVTIYAVCATDVTEVSEDMTDKVQAAVPRVVEMILADIGISATRADIKISGNNS